MWRRRAGADPHDVRRGAARAGGRRGREPGAAGAVARGRARGGVRARTPRRLHAQRPPPAPRDSQRQLPGAPLALSLMIILFLCLVHYNNPNLKITGFLFIP